MRQLARVNRANRRVRLSHLQRIHDGGPVLGLNAGLGVERDEGSDAKPAGELLVRPDRRRILEVLRHDFQDAHPSRDAGQVAEQQVTGLDLLYRLPPALAEAGDGRAYVAAGDGRAYTTSRNALRVTPVKRSSQ